MIVWNRGTYCPDSALAMAGGKEMARKDQEKEIKSGLKKGKLAFTLYGKKLHGSWTLVKTKRREKDWLLIKHTDQFVDTEHDITEEDVSVLSKKQLSVWKKLILTKTDN